MTKKTQPHDGLRVLFADDEEAIQELMCLELPRMGHEVTVCPDGETAVAALEKNAYDCMIVDLDMPGMSGIEVIGHARELAPDVEAVVLTGKSSLESAIAALRHGAFDYLTKPCRLVELDALLQRIRDKRELSNKYRAVQCQLERATGSPQLVGESTEMLEVRRRIERVAPTNSCVLILGETGTGKELIARAIHDESQRADKPFVPINCGALPENLIESELFGHRKGAFTGADTNRTGLFEVAHGGTLFLDEIGELPKSLQAKLLRVLESGEIRRLGDNQPFRVDVRLVCATHRNLENMVREGDFREDLMFRINTFELMAPPLRKRKKDIPLLVQHLVKRFSPMLARAKQAFSDEALKALAEHLWPGNVRELANVVEHATILCDEPPVTLHDLPPQFDTRELRVSHLNALGSLTLKELEAIAIDRAIARCDGNKTKAAEALGISLKTLYNRMNQPVSKSA